MARGNSWRKIGPPSNHPNPLNTLATLLAQTTGELQDFLAAIADERRALVKGDINQLPIIAEKKSTLALRLSNLEELRETALVAGGFGNGREGIAGWLAATPAATRQTARNAWRHYLEQAAKARHENEINGKLIATRLQQNHQALTTLLGETADSSTYSADGRRSAMAGRRPLGSA